MGPLHRDRYMVEFNRDGTFQFVTDPIDNRQIKKSILCGHRVIQSHQFAVSIAQLSIWNSLQSNQIHRLGLQSPSLMEYFFSDRSRKSIRVYLDSVFGDKKDFQWSCWHLSCPLTVRYHTFPAIHPSIMMFVRGCEMCRDLGRHRRFLRNNTEVTGSKTCECVLLYA